MKNISEDTQEMPQSRSIALTRHQKEEEAQRIKESPQFRPQMHKKLSLGLMLVR